MATLQRRFASSIDAPDPGTLRKSAREDPRRRCEIPAGPNELPAVRLGAGGTQSPSLSRSRRCSVVFLVQFGVTSEPRRTSGTVRWRASLIRVIGLLTSLRVHCASRGAEVSYRLRSGRAADVDDRRNAWSSQPARYGGDSSQQRRLRTLIVASCRELSQA